MSQEDEQLVLLSRQGDKNAFSCLFHKYSKMVYGMAFHLLGSKEGLEDVVQETFLRAYQQLFRLKEPHLFSSWLGGICKYVAQESLRNKKTKPFSLEQLKEETKLLNKNVSSLDETHREEIFNQVEELPPIFREVILLKYLHQMSYQEMAILLNISEAAINARLLKAKMLLKKKLPPPSSV